MKTVRFINKDRTQFASALKKNVNDYFKEAGISQKANQHMVVKSLLLLSMLIVPFILVLTLPANVWLIVLLSLIMGIGTAGIGMSVMHDAAHGSYSNNTLLNGFMAGTIYLLGGNLLTWKIQHNFLHHTYTNIEGMDEDIQSKGVFRFSRHSEVKKIHRFQHIYALFFYSLMTITKLPRDFFQLNVYNKSGITLQQKVKPTIEYIIMAATKGFYLFLLIGLPILFTEYT